VLPQVYCNMRDSCMDEGLSDKADDAVSDVIVQS
jgi:hypothetical protein